MKTLDEQIIDMAQVFPRWSCKTLDRRTAVWNGHLRPHKTEYNIQIEFTVPIFLERQDVPYLQPLVKILSPQLKKRFGNAEGPLPHVYWKHPRTNLPGPFLCLFDTDTLQWTMDDLISNTTVVWSSIWLSCYEGWLATGTWLGTGKHVLTHSNDRSARSVLMEHFNATTSHAALTSYTA